MQRTLNQLLKDAVERKPRRLSFDTTYSHDNIYDWLQTILTDWTIPGSSCSTFALSDWPAIGITQNVVKQWLEEKNQHKPDDLIDGVCEPLACYLSSSISSLNLGSILDVTEGQESRYLSSNIYKQTNDILDQLEPRLAAELIFGNYMKQKIQSPQFWHEEFGNSYKNFLFGHPLAIKRLKAIVAPGGDSTKIFPLYMLCYLFDNNELTNAQLKKEESAQYSLHVVRLVINNLNKTVVIADPNGALIGGSNMEFLTMPLTKLQSKPTTMIE
jgi:hypothetical protein